MAPHYRSLVGGYFSAEPYNLDIPRSIRTNNPLALNISDWQRNFPGFAGVTQPDASANANKTTIYETPEHGFAAWYELMVKYNAAGADTVGEIINRYGGGQDYSGYLAFVLKHEPSLQNGTRIDLKNIDQCIKLARVMARHEAGNKMAFPWTDAQIRYGIQLGMQRHGGAVAPAPKPVPTETTVTKTGGGFWALLGALFAAIFGVRAKPVIASRILKRGDMSDKGGDVWLLQEKLRAIGFTDLVVDGDFGDNTDKAVRTFQDYKNLLVDGEVGDLTLKALNATTGTVVQQPPLIGPPDVAGGEPQLKPGWYKEAEKWIGWKEVGNNQNIGQFIAGAKAGQIGDPYCAIGVNFCLETTGVRGSRSAAARSFERDPNFTRLSEPVLGCIVTQWRGTKTPLGQPGLGHVYFADGIDPAGNIRGIGFNEDNGVKRSMHSASRTMGMYWPKGIPIPQAKLPLVSSGGQLVTRET